MNGGRIGGRPRNRVLLCDYDSNNDKVTIHASCFVTMYCVNLRLTIGEGLCVWRGGWKKFCLCFYIVM